jgi:hypothetical protein
MSKHRSGGSAAFLDCAGFATLRTRRCEVTNVTRFTAQRDAAISQALVCTFRHGNCRDYVEIFGVGCVRAGTASPPSGHFSPPCLAPALALTAIDPRMLTKVDPYSCCTIVGTAKIPRHLLAKVINII